MIGQRRGALRLRALVLALLLTLAPTLALSGCGGQAEEVREAGRYAEQVNTVQANFERDLVQLKRSTSQLDNRTDIDRAVRRLTRRITGVEDELRKIEPPAAIAAAHRELITAFNGWQAPLEAFRRALRDRDLAATQKAKTDFSTGTAEVEARINTALTRINDQLRSLSD
ncbi:MAG: hypothetical protein WC558_11945 [Patulibacter sp.]